MSPPIDIDGSEIQRATIDGVDVSEITIDGQQTADFFDIPDSDLTQDLVAWYRFEDGDARDYTAILNATFADSTAYDGTVNGASFLSTGGVTDFENGANSGAFEFDGNGENIDTNSSGPITGGPFSITGWFNFDGPLNGEKNTIVDIGRTPSTGALILNDGGEQGLQFQLKPSGKVQTPIPSLNTFHFFGCTFDGSSTIKLYLNSGTSPVASDFSASFDPGNNDFRLGTDTFSNHWDGLIDDIRVYHTELSGSQVNQIFEDTRP